MHVYYIIFHYVSVGKSVIDELERFDASWRIIDANGSSISSIFQTAVGFHIPPVMTAILRGMRIRTSSGF